MERPLPAGLAATLLKEVQSDTQSGATEITKKAASCILAFSEQGQPSATECYEQLVSLGQAIIDAHPMMSSLFNLVNRVLLDTDGTHPRDSVKALQRAIQESARRFQESTLTGLAAIAQHGQTVLHPHATVMTHSSSSTVAGILREARSQGKAIRAIATESRPFCEGRELARNLGQQGIPTQVVLDAAAAPYVKEADVVIVGVDRIAEKSFLNKVGTLAIAMAARQQDVPFYVACESNKFLPASVIPMGNVLKSSEQRAQEDWMNVELVYSMFEEIPNQWLTGIITEKGILSMDALAKHFQAFKVHPELAKRAVVAP
jgi:translation initiation factor 2B subunit (eIF-2B alpha/beta/delta family)